MKTFALLCILLATVTVGFDASAQTAASPAPTVASPTPRPTPPPGPLLNKAPDFSAWTVIMQVGSGQNDKGARPGGHTGAQASPPPESVASITKTGLIRHIIKKTREGGQEDVWRQGDYVLTNESSWGQQVQVEVKPSQNGVPTGDFPDLDWISASNFVGIKQVDGTPCLVFDGTVLRGDAQLLKQYNSKQEEQANRAYIDLDTRLPRISQTPTSVSRYVFQSAPTTMLVLPANLQAMIDARVRIEESLKRMPMHP